MGSPESHPCRRGHRVSGPANEHQRNSEAGGDGGGERRDEHLEKKPDGLLGRQLPEVRGRGRHWAVVAAGALDGGQERRRHEADQTFQARWGPGATLRCAARPSGLGSVDTAARI